MDRRELENLHLNSSFTKRLKICKIREELELKSILAWMDIIWNDIMNSGERELYKKYPHNFKAMNRITYISSSVVENYNHPDLPEPTGNLSLTSSYLTGVDGFRYNIGTSYHYKIPDLGKHVFYRDITKFCSSGATCSLGIQLPFFNRKEHKNIWHIPKIDYKEPGLKFLKSGILRSSLRDDSDITLPLDNPRVKKFKDTVLEYIRAFRLEYRQRIELENFLLTKGVSPDRVKKLWPELFA